MRISFIVFGALIAFAVAQPAQAQSGFDRSGSDYTSFAVPNGDPSVCAGRCEKDAHCRAWSFSYPRMFLPLATCWLKNKVPPRVEDDCCVSGVRGAGIVAPRRVGAEYSIDRSGGDYRHFETDADSTGDACKAACDGESRCRAWTYVRPGYAGSSARCYLKSKITRPRHKPCCISGVVR